MNLFRGILEGFDCKFQNTEAVVGGCSIYKIGLLKYCAKFTEHLCPLLLIDIVAGLRVTTSLTRDSDIDVFLKIKRNFKEYKQLRWLHLGTLICENANFCSWFCMFYERIKYIF